jgi:metallo-beta-lactamase class B
MLVLALGAGCAGQAGVPADMRAWNRDFPPFHVIGNIYYVGSAGVAQFLITTSAGHFLLDSGFEASVPRLRENVRSLGFKFEDVKVLLTSHAHIDHAQGHARVRAVTGARVVASAGDAPFIAAGGKGEPVFDGVYSWTPCPVDQIVSDGDAITLGNTVLVAHVTPGHTMGATTWTMKVDGADGRPLDVVFFPSANINPGVHLLGNARYPSIAQDFARSFTSWRALPCDVFLGVHGEFFGLAQKKNRRDRGAANPFIDPHGYRQFVEAAETRFQAQLAEERQGTGGPS